VSQVYVKDCLANLIVLPWRTGTGVDQYSVWLRTGWQTPGRGKRIFPLTSVSRPALGPTQPPVQWVPGVLSPGVKRGRGVKMTTHPHLMPRSRMSRSYVSPSPRTPIGALWECFTLPWSLNWNSSILMGNRKTNWQLMLPALFILASQRKGEAEVGTSVCLVLLSYTECPIRLKP
jgi:hypothetical protein